MADGVVKRKKGETFHTGEQKIILNVRSYLREKNPNFKEKELDRETSLACGVGTRTV